MTRPQVKYLGRAWPALAVFALLSAVLAGAPSSVGKIAALITGLVLVGFLFWFYFLPALIARERSHPNVEAIFAINLLLGWTLVGWVVALAWALPRAPS
jgi:hypothetical protein